MYELPEVVRLAGQLREVALGRVACRVRFLKEHGFLFRNADEHVMTGLVSGRKLVSIHHYAKRLELRFDGGPCLAFDEMGGHLRWVDGDPPLAPHAIVEFEDGCVLAMTVQMWGFISATPQPAQREPAHAPAADDPLFTLEWFARRLSQWPDRNKKAIKALMVSPYAVTGIGNGYLHDILWHAQVSPKSIVALLPDTAVAMLYQAVVQVVSEATELGGRDTERDLFGGSGGYRPILDRRAEGEPCPRCGDLVSKFAFLGGSCYVCPTCQVPIRP